MGLSSSGTELITAYNTGHANNNRVIRLRQLVYFQTNKLHIVALEPKVNIPISLHTSTVGCLVRKESSHKYVHETFDWMVSKTAGKFNQ